MAVKEKKLHENTVENNADVLNSIINAKIETIQEKINECNSKIEEEIVNLGHAIYETTDWGEYEEGMGIYALSGKSVGYIGTIAGIAGEIVGTMKKFEKTEKFGDQITAELVIYEICKKIRNYKDEIKNYEKKIEEIKNINNILN